MSDRSDDYRVVSSTLSPLLAVAPYRQLENPTAGGASSRSTQGSDGTFLSVLPTHVE